MNREKALSLLKQYVKNDNLIKHCLAAESVMRELALKLNQDPQKWGLAGLLHDIDVEVTGGDLKTHTHKAVEILKENNISDEVIESIKMHNCHAWEKKSEEVFHIALRAAETITGLIVATALVYPDKKLSSVKVESILKRFKDKRFAAGADRETIKECEKLGFSLNDFAAISLSAMQKIAGELGL
ncbi:MAG: HDIG domain-containing protein [Elusimicrobiota bacterium]